jgi:hypothetical protein
MDPNAQTKANANEGDTSNAGSGEQSQSEQQKPNYLTSEQASELINKAITGHLKRLPKGLAAEDLVKLLDEREAKAKEAQQSKASNDGEKAAETVKLQQRLDQLDKQLREERELRQKYEKDQRAANQNVALSRTLEAGGVAGIRLRASMAFLRAEGLVRENDAGELVYVDAGDEVDLGKGIVKWLATADGKEFLPASGAKGAGSNAGRNGPSSRESESEKEMSVIREYLSGGIG